MQLIGVCLAYAQLEQATDVKCKRRLRCDRLLNRRNSQGSCISVRLVAQAASCSCLEAITPHANAHRRHLRLWRSNEWEVGGGSPESLGSLERSAGRRLSFCRRSRSRGPTPGARFDLSSGTTATPSPVLSYACSRPASGSNPQHRLILGVARPIPSDKLWNSVYITQLKIHWADFRSSIFSPGSTSSSTPESTTKRRLTGRRPAPSFHRTLP